jgi:uncharacterized protein DUF955
MLDVAETLVAAFCRALGFDGVKRRPKVDIYQLAKQIGAEPRIDRGLRQDGKVEDLPLETRIFLQSSPTTERRRFTLGHELGHLVLSDPRVFRMVQFELGDEGLQVERLCDAFAAELLMPRLWVAKQYDGAEEGFDALRDLTRRAGVSISAGYIHLAEVLRWESTLIYLSRDDWTCSIAGSPQQSSQLIDVELAHRSVTLLRDLPPFIDRSRRQFERVSASLELKVGDESQYEVTSELFPTPNGIWFMALLPQPPEQGRRPSRPAPHRA